jgi:hypothetical protein
VTKERGLADGFKAVTIKAKNRINHENQISNETFRQG